MMKLIELIIKMLMLPFVVFFVIAFAIIDITLGYGLSASKMLIEDYLNFYY